jgi:hypothetical protein
MGILLQTLPSCSGDSHGILFQTLPLCSGDLNGNNRADIRFHFTLSFNYPLQVTKQIDLANLCAHTFKSEMSG